MNSRDAIHECLGFVSLRKILYRVGIMGFFVLWSLFFWTREEHLCLCYLFVCLFLALADLSASAGSKVVVVTANAWSNEQSYASVVQTNVDLYRGIIPGLARHSPNAVLLIASQPGQSPAHNTCIFYSQANLRRKAPPFWEGHCWRFILKTLNYI